MKTTLKIKEGLDSTIKAWTSSEVGKEWVGGDNRRFYFDEALLNAIGNDLVTDHDFSFDFAYSGLYVDLKTAEYGFNREISSEELAAFEVELKKIFNKFKEGANKKIFSTWTGDIRLCTTINHFIGTTVEA